MQENKNVYNANYSLEAVSLFNALDNVAHNFAIERGLTAGFIASEGLSGKEKLIQQRKKIRPRRKKLTKFQRGVFR
jgi:hypothetical protein